MKNQILGILGKKLLLYILTLSLIPALILSYIHYVHSKRLLEIELFNELSLIGDALAEHIDAFLRHGENSAKHFSSDGFIRDRMESMITAPDNINVSKELSKYLEYKTKLEPRFLETFTINQKGIVVASSSLPLVGVNMSDDLHTLETKGDSFVKDAYFCDVTGEYSLVFYSSVKHKDTGVFLGMIGIRMLASELDRITVGNKQAFAVTSSSVPSSVEQGEKKEYLFSRGTTYFKPPSVETPQTAHEKGFKMRYSTELTTLTRRGGTSEAYLVNKNKLMLTSSRFIDNVLLRQEVDTLPVNTAIKEGKEIFGIYRDYRNVPVVGASKYIKSMNWILLVEVDVWEAFQPVYRARNYSLSIIAACIFIISALAFLISHRIINPIKSLITATAKISKGDLDYHIQPTSRDEIGKLTDDFNRMTTNLATARNELRELFDAANDPMVTLKDGNMINNMNARVSELFGYTTEDLLLKKITRIIRNEDVPIVEDAINKAWRLKPGEKTPMLEVGVMKNDGNVLICELDLNRTRLGIQPISGHYKKKIIGAKGIRRKTETRRVQHETPKSSGGAKKNPITVISIRKNGIYRTVGRRYCP